MLGLKLNHLSKRGPWWLISSRITIISFSRACYDASHEKLAPDQLGQMRAIGFTLLTPYEIWNDYIGGLVDKIDLITSIVLFNYVSEYKYCQIVEIIKG